MSTCGLGTSPCTRPRRRHTVGAGEDVMTRVSIVVALALLWPATTRAQGEKEEEEPQASSASDEEEPPGGSKKKKPKAAPDEEEPESSKKGTADGSASVSSEDLIEEGAPKGRMTLPGGKFMLSAIVETNLAKGAAGKPLSVAPDLWIGLHDRLTV